jgi:hypothetical protein
VGTANETQHQQSIVLFNGLNLAYVDIFQTNKSLPKYGLTQIYCMPAQATVATFWTEERYYQRNKLTINKGPRIFSSLTVQQCGRQKAFESKAAASVNKLSKENISKDPREC